MANVATVDIGDYRYTLYDGEHPYASVQVIDNTKSSYGTIEDYIIYDSVTYSVTNMTSCFSRCTALTTVPTIPNSVTNMNSCFMYCTSLTTAPVIPSSVTNMNNCFYNCTSLSGDVYILRDGVPFYYSDCFRDTTQPIILHTYNYDYESELIATANNNNVTAGAHGADIMVLNTRALTDTENTSYDVVGGIRVDMVIDCSHAGYLIGYSPSYMTLYDMNDNIINFNFGVEHPTYIRCYGVLDNTNNDFPVIPSSSNLVDVSVKNVAPIYAGYDIELPSTAQSCKIIQDGETDLMSPRVNLQDIRFNPIGTNTNVYNVLDILRVIVGQNIPAYTGGMNSAQINKEDDIKHYVASADNIMVNETTTLQDYITNLYNSLS